MRNRILFFTALLMAVACKETKEQNSVRVLRENEIASAVSDRYPEALQLVFEAHGGLNAWKDKELLVYEIPKDSFSEIHTIDLDSRKDKIETPQYEMGFDGNDVWILDPLKVYKGDPIFYHNLMFYFYAMPFVLADDGIAFSDTHALSYEGKEYPGIRISYNSGIGTSPEDEYYIHFDPETFQMAWLGYTVTYKTGEKSDNVKWIRYDDWFSVDGIMLPHSITWHNYDDKTILDARNTVFFENIHFEKRLAGDLIFNKPEGALIMTR